MRWVGIDKDNWKTAQTYTKNHNALHWFYELNVLGYKYNMNDLAASIGLQQLQKLPTMNTRRSEIIHQYVDGLKMLKVLSHYCLTNLIIMSIRCLESEPKSEMN